MNKKEKRRKEWKHDLSINKSLYFFAVPVVVYFIIFCYVPMFGVVMAFQDYKPARGILGSRFVGLKNFKAFFGGPNFLTLLRNTFVINALGLFVGFPLT